MINTIKLKQEDRNEDSETRLNNTRVDIPYFCDLKNCIYLKIVLIEVILHIWMK